MPHCLCMLLCRPRAAVRRSNLRCLHMQRTILRSALLVLKLASVAQNVQANIGTDYHRVFMDDSRRPEAVDALWYTLAAISDSIRAYHRDVATDEGAYLKSNLGAQEEQSSDISVVSTHHCSLATNHQGSRARALSHRAVTCC